MPQLLSRINYSFFATISLICGITWQSLAYSQWIPVLIFSTILASIILSKKAIMQIKILVLFGFLFACGSIRYAKQQYNFYEFYEQFSHGLYNLVGTIQEIIPISRTNFSYRLSINIQELQTHNHKTCTNINKTVHIYTNSTTNLDIGDFIKIKNISFKKTDNQSFNNYLIKENVIATIFLPHPTIEIINRPKYSLHRWITHCKNGLIENIKKKLTPTTYKIFLTIFLGEQEAKHSLTDIKNSFRYWGILHYLARSGLHLVLFILLLQLLLNIVPCSYLLKQLFLIIITSIYSILSWPSVSFNRAFLTLLFYQTSKILNLQFNLLNTLSVVCLVTLIYNPMQLFFLDYQLSFSLTAALACFNLFHK